MESRKGAGVFVRAFRPLRRSGLRRLSREQWGTGRSIWSTDTEGRDLIVDEVEVEERPTPDGGIYARLAELGHEPVRFREEVRCRMPTAQESARLALPAGTPVVDLCRTAYTAGGSPVEVNLMTLDASSYILEYEFGA
ncbi:hypothetical protein GCM10027168_00580 [Streptomyces capparidis]